MYKMSLCRLFPSLLKFCDLILSIYPNTHQHFIYFVQIVYGQEMVVEISTLIFFSFSNVSFYDKRIHF